MYDKTDNADLELIFAEVRKYPLLTADEEKEIDRQKWGSVRSLSTLFADAPELRQILATLLKHCLLSPPEVKQFGSREQHFILRRELSPFLPEGKLSEVAEEVVERLSRKASKKSYFDAIMAVQLPASLTVGIAVFMLRLAGEKFSDSVADAVQDWARNWDMPPSAINIESQLLKRMQETLKDYTDARDALVMHNLRLVHSIAGRNRGRGVAYLDLVQEGTLGLIRAAEKFEFAKGYRFSTYCFNWITQSIRRYVGDTGNLIRLPSHVQDQINKVYRERTIQQARTGIEPDSVQIAKSLDMDKQKTREILEIRNLSISLDAPRFDDDEGSLVDDITSESFGNTTRNTEMDSLHKFLDDAVNQLESNEKAVVVARWGLHKGPALSRSEIADRLGVSREWVRQLERSALRKLKDKDCMREAFLDYTQEASSRGGLNNY